MISTDDSTVNQMPNANQATDMAEEVKLQTTSEADFGVVWKRT